jgi:hypothetical protein
MMLGKPQTSERVCSSCSVTTEVSISRPRRPAATVGWSSRPAPDRRDLLFVMRAILTVPDARGPCWCQWLAGGNGPFPSVSPRVFPGVGDMLGG